MIGRVLSASVTLLFAEKHTHSWSNLRKTTYLRAPMRSKLWDRLRLPDKVWAEVISHFKRSIIDWKILWCTKKMVIKSSSFSQSYYCLTSELTLWVWTKCSTLTWSTWVLISTNFSEWSLKLKFYLFWLLAITKSNVFMNLSCRLFLLYDAHIHLHGLVHVFYVSLPAPPAPFIFFLSFSTVLLPILQLLQYIHIQNLEQFRFVALGWPWFWN